jgi:hypothetical protein
VKYWENIADNLSKAGWGWGCVAAIDSNGRTIFVADAHRVEIGKRTRAGGNDTFSSMKTLLSIILAVAVSISTALAKHGGGHGGHRGHGGYHGKHGKHFSSISPRGGRKFSRSGSQFSRGTSGKYRNWSGRNWGGRNWSGRNWSGSDRFIFIGGYGYPYWGWYPSWGWSVPYAYYSYYPYKYYPYDSCSVSRRQFYGP